MNGFGWNKAIQDLHCQGFDDMPTEEEVARHRAEHAERLMHEAEKRAAVDAAGEYEDLKTRRRWLAEDLAALDEQIAQLEQEHDFLKDE